MTASDTRARAAACACALWLLGFDVGPVAHMVFHEALEEHHHGHDDGHAHRHDGDAPSPIEHGEGSVAHRDLAASVPLPSVPPVLEALFAESVPEVAPQDERAGDLRPQTTRARAPPAWTA